MHPALRSWRDDLPASFVRLLAYLGAIVLLSTAATYIVQSKKVTSVIAPAHVAEWIAVERPIPAFTLSIPEAADVPASYAIFRHIFGGGRKDILTLGEHDSSAPFLQVEIYRPGNESDEFSPLLQAIADEAASLSPVDLRREPEPLDTKFGPLGTATFRTAAGAPRECRAFGRSYADPRLQLSGWFCQGGALIEGSTIACALDRLTLLSAGSEPKVSALFAQAELHRSYCGQHDPILAATPKYHLLWKALANRPQPRRIGR
jgi:hypothetical protein